MSESLSVASFARPVLPFSMPEAALNLAAAEEAGFTMQKSLAKNAKVDFPAERIARVRDGLKRAEEILREIRIKPDLISKNKQDYTDVLERIILDVHLLGAELSKLNGYGLGGALGAEWVVGDGAKFKGLLNDSGMQSLSGGFFDGLYLLIATIEKEFLAVYEALMEVYGDFFSDFTDIIAQLGSWTGTTKKEGDDTVYTSVEVVALKNALTGLYKEYEQVVLYPLDPSDRITQEEAEDWANTLGGKAVNDPEKGWVVKMDLSPLETMIKAIPGENLPSGTHVFDNDAEYNAWLTGFNAQKSEIENELQLISTKYNNANSYYENFIKILSSQLNQFTEMLKGFTTY